MMTETSNRRMVKILRFLIRELILGIIGGLIYMYIETTVRGFTHWTMGIVGGLCFIIIGLINEWYTEDMLFETQTLIGGFVITALEFISGYILNIQLGLNIWDYSNRFLNLYGQVCLHHTLLYWIPLSAIAILLDDVIRSMLFDESHSMYHFIFQKWRK